MMLNLRCEINRNVIRWDAPLTFESRICLYRRWIDANSGAINGWRAQMQSERKKPASSIRATDIRTADAGKVRIGGFSPKLPPVRPTPAEVRDNGKVSVGGFSPKL
jgi:hypothetical protein